MMKINIINKSLLFTVFLMTYSVNGNASYKQVVFQVPVQIDYPGSNMTPAIACNIADKGQIIGSGEIGGGIPFVHFQKVINVVVKAKPGKHFTKGMKYECYLTPYGNKPRGRYGVAAQYLQNEEVYKKAKRKILYRSGTL